MAELLDSFSSDPFASNWTSEVGTNVWDSTDLEIDMENGAGNAVIRRSAGGPGSIEHEAQVTTTTASTGGLMGPTVRHANDGTVDCYVVNVTSAGNLLIQRFINTVRSTIDVVGSFITVTDGNFYTICFAAEGSAGGDVTLSVRIVDHGASKPSDPGWLDMSSPGRVFTDTDGANRLNDGSVHLHCGIGGGDIGGGAAIDTRHDYWKARNITDRSAGGGDLSALIGEPICGSSVLN